MSEGIVIAIIGAVGVVLAAVITGIFTVFSKGKPSKQSILKQSQRGKNNTQIGIQNNNTIHIGGTTADNGTLIIDCGDASGGGEIRCEPAGNISKKEGNINE